MRRLALPPCNATHIIGFQPNATIDLDHPVQYFVYLHRCQWVDTFSRHPWLMVADSKLTAGLFMVGNGRYSPSPPKKKAPKRHLRRHLTGSWTIRLGTDRAYTRYTDSFLWLKFVIPKVFLTKMYSCRGALFDSDINQIVWLLGLSRPH